MYNLKKTKKKKKFFSISFSNFLILSDEKFGCIWIVEKAKIFIFDAGVEISINQSMKSCKLKRKWKKKEKKNETSTTKCASSILSFQLSSVKKLNRENKNNASISLNWKLNIIPSSIINKYK